MFITLKWNNKRKHIIKFHLILNKYLNLKYYNKVGSYLLSAAMLSRIEVKKQYNLKAWLVIFWNFVIIIEIIFSLYTKSW